MEQWCREHYIITSLAILWGLSITTAVTLKVFFDPVEIPTGTATAFATFFALPPAIIGLIKWRREHKQKNVKGEE